MKQVMGAFDENLPMFFSICIKFSLSKFLQNNCYNYNNYNLQKHINMKQNRVLD